MAPISGSTGDHSMIISATRLQCNCLYLTVSRMSSPSRAPKRGCGPGRSCAPGEWTKDKSLRAWVRHGNSDLAPTLRYGVAAKRIQICNVLIRLMERIEGDAYVKGFADGVPGPPGAGAVSAMDLGLGELAGADGRVGLLDFDVEHVLLAYQLGQHKDGHLRGVG